MIPTLLWRCPLCAAEDALVHASRPFRADRVHCRRCQVVWRVRRVPGDDFYLRVVRTASPPGDALPVGTELPLVAWYDRMKAGLRLVPRADPEFALPPGEELYLASGPAELRVEEGDPLFFPGSEGVARVDKRQVEGCLVGPGRLFLTNRRLVWHDPQRRCDLPLARLNSAYAVMDLGVALLVDMRLYTAYFLGESLLKWVTYLALVGRQVEQETGHHIATSHF